MLPDRVSNPGPLTYESGALPIALRGPAEIYLVFIREKKSKYMYSLYFTWSETNISGHGKSFMNMESVSFPFQQYRYFFS